MITKDELRIIDRLRDDKEILDGLLKSFDNRYVKSSIGLISVYLDVTNESIGENEDYAQLFRNMFKNEINQMNDNIKKEIQARIKHIDVELSRYIEIIEED